MKVAPVNSAMFVGGDEEVAEHEWHCLWCSTAVGVAARECCGWMASSARERCRSWALGVVVRIGGSGGGGEEVAVVGWQSMSGVSKWCHLQCLPAVGGILVAPVTWQLDVMQVVVGLGRVCIVMSGDVAQGSCHWHHLQISSLALWSCCSRHSYRKAEEVLSDGVVPPAMSDDGGGQATSRWWWKKLVE